MAWLSSSSKAVIAKNVTDTIAFCAAGATTVRQRATETVSEYRGLTASAAQALAGTNDATTRTTYYATINGTDYSLTLLSGTVTVTTAQRSNEANGWRAIERSITYSAVDLSTSVWKTSRTTSAGVSAKADYAKTMAYVFSYNGNTLFSTTVTQTEEWRHIDTEANATSKANANTTSSVTYTKLKCASGGGTYFMTLPTGTEKHASWRYVSAEDGYAVTVTTTTYGWANASGNTNNWTVAS